MCVGIRGGLCKLTDASTEDRIDHVIRRIVNEIDGQGKDLSLAYLGGTLDNQRTLGSYQIDRYVCFFISLSFFEYLY